MLIPLQELIARHKLNITGILHVGASEGQERDAYEACGIWKVIWIEALPHIHAKLVENIKPFRGHMAIQACVSDVEEEVVFHESSNGGQSSSYLDFGTHKEAHPDVTFIAEHRMKTQRIDKLFYPEDNTLTRVNYLSMDLQGAELKALRGMGELIKQFDYAYLEVNTGEVYKGCAQLDSLDLFMISKGFRRVEEKIFHQWGWGDALYIRNGL